MSEKQKKPGFFERLFGTKKSKDDDDVFEPERRDGHNEHKKTHSTKSSSSADGACTKNSVRPTTKDSDGASKPKTKSDGIGDAKKSKPPTTTRNASGTGGSSSGGQSGSGSVSSGRGSAGDGSGAPTKKQQQQTKQRAGKRSRKRAKKSAAPLKVDASTPLEFPTTPELILAHHKAKPFLNKNEEWLLVELNEYECLVDTIDIIKTIAKHSKFFEVEPDELWEEFFEFVDDVPSYDEVINFDVWQEFRDNKYPC